MEHNDGCVGTRSDRLRCLSVKNDSKSDKLMKERLKFIRNIGFVAHIDAGKTTTTERVLFMSGKLYKIGEVDDGTTTTDWMEQERERGITITSAATYCRWGEYNINIIDTPGHIDFTVEVERSLKILDGAVVIFCGVGGVEPQSETVWRQADKYHVARIAFVNKMDRPGADFISVIRQIEDRLAPVAAAINFPIYDNGKFVGIVDLIKRQAVYYTDELGEGIVYKEIPSVLKEEAVVLRDKLIDKLAQCDDEFMNKFIQQEKIEEDDVIKTIRRNVISNRFYPILCGSALKNKGIQLLLDAIVDFLSSPEDLKDRKSTRLNSSHTDISRMPSSA